jgi:thiol:disulfide interchange protein DsbA
MNPQRRELLGAAACTAAWALVPATARAQGGPQVNRDFRLVEPAQPADAAGKIDVSEFFGYWCPHCAEFEPLMTPYVKKLPSDVAFRYVPVAFIPQQDVYSKLYYTLDAMGQVQNLHAKVFDAIHKQNNHLETPEKMAEFVGANGVDAAKFLETYKSFGVQSRASQAKRICDAYRVEGTPALAVAGRYYTAPSMTGDGPGALRTVDWLVDQARKNPSKG